MDSTLKVFDFISHFTRRFIGFEEHKPKYERVDGSNSEYIMIVMDRVARLERDRGRLRNRVWSHFYFIFHDGTFRSTENAMKRIMTIKDKYPYLFIRSYVYFVFIDISEFRRRRQYRVNGVVDNTDFKIWFFNSNYEIKSITSKEKLIQAKLNEGEKFDDIMYIANPASELARIKSANSDVIDCIRAFTGDLELLDQTVRVMSEVCSILEKDPKARILLEGPARSGKTIIAASLLGKYKYSKFLLMNYFFYNAIVDGLHALSVWSKEEIEQLIKNPKLDELLDWQLKLHSHFRIIHGLLNKVLHQLDLPNNQNTTEEQQSPVIELIELPPPNNQSSTIDQLLSEFRKLFNGFERIKVDYRGFGSLSSLYDFYIEMNNLDQNSTPLEISKDKVLDVNELDSVLLEINKEKVLEAIELVGDILDKKALDMRDLENVILEAVAVIIKDSKQKFFHHNINKRYTDGCWLRRGNPTVSRLWSDSYSSSLIICDEVQRLGFINSFNTYDKFDEIDQILSHSDQTFFTGDDFQKLNHNYDKGIIEIKNKIKSRNEILYSFKLPDAVGIPTEIGLLMKYLTNPDKITAESIAKIMQISKVFDILVLYNNQAAFIDLFDEDESVKKHFASPMDSLWSGKNTPMQLLSSKRQKPITAIWNHPVEDFAYRYPYFCNEEIMPNYVLSAYELISREVESLYVHIPRNKNYSNDQWYKNHLYVLFTRPTRKLVINYEDMDSYMKFESLAKNVEKHDVKLPIKFLSTEYW